MYYLWAILISSILFIIIQINDYYKDKDKYKLLNINNISLYIILYILCIIILYFILNDNNGNNEDILKTDIDPFYLKKINEEINIGFTPF